MNCPRCNADLPNESAFCSQYGNQEMRLPIFPPDPQEPRKNNTGLYVLFGCIGCGCLAGVVLVVLMVFGMFLSSHKGHPEMGIAIPPVESIAYRPIAYRIGSDFTLYGKTLDNEDFDWESFRGKYVLVKFTATWCPPCIMAIPDMLDTYEKYRDKDFEIVSAYVFQHEADPVATVKRFVEQRNLPWIILSEALTAQAGLPPQGEAFGIEGVPTMVLVNKEGKVISINGDYKQELRKVFGE